MSNFPDLFCTRNSYLCPRQMGGMPYSFGYIVDDEHTNNYQTRQEEGGADGVVDGCYQVRGGGRVVEG